jgi:ribosome-binding factor A
MSVRQEKVGSLIRHEISLMLQRLFTVEEAGFVTVTDVVMSPDLKVARVYVSIFGRGDQKEETLAVLEEHKGQIRSELGARVRLKFTPAISFLLDETLDHALRIERLIAEIHRDEDGQKRDG